MGRLIFDLPEIPEQVRGKTVDSRVDSSCLIYGLVLARTNGMLILIWKRNAMHTRNEVTKS